MHVAEPMFRLNLFKIRAFTAGNISALLGALGRGGLQLMLIIWLQGIWLPQHGYSFAQTPLWAGVFMVPADDRVPGHGTGVGRAFRPPGLPRASHGWASYQRGHLFALGAACP